MSSTLSRFYFPRRSNSNNATRGAAPDPFGGHRNCPGHRRGNHRGLALLLLLATAAPRFSSSTVNLGKAGGGVASPADGGGRTFELPLPKEGRFDDDGDVDVNFLDRGNTFKFDINGSIYDGEGNGVSLYPALYLFCLL